MSHQPFETWIFSDEPLGTDQQQELDAHLATCAQCKQLSTAMIQVQKTFASSTAVLPAAGFSERWQQRWSAHQYSRQQTRMWLLTFGLFAAAGLVIAGLMLFNLFNINWTYEFARVIANVGLLASQTRRFWTVFKSFTTAFPILIPVMLVFGTGLLSAMCVLVITWFSSLYQLYQPYKESVIER